MSDKKMNHSNGEYSDKEAAWALIKDAMNRKATRSFWIGVVTGILFMAVMNVGDMHMCVGECDGDGIKLIAGSDQ